MDEEQPRIVLGRPVERLQVGGIKAKPRPQPAPSADPPRDINKPGFTLEGQRRAEQRRSDLVAKKKQLPVNPVILTAALVVPILFIFAIFVSGSSSTSLSYNNKEVLARYEKYVKKNPGKQLPDVDAVRTQLNGITYLENTGHKAEARQAWMSIFVSTRSDREAPVVDGVELVNPLYTLAKQRLQR